MVRYNKVNVKLSDSQLNKLKTEVKDQTGVTLRMNIKIFNENNLLHELLLLTTRQTTKLRNAIEKGAIEKEKKGGFLSMLLGTLGASLLGNMLAGKGIVRAGYGNKERKGVVRAGYGNKKFF